jgi:uncharacterized protein (DUF433 family)
VQSRIEVSPGVHFGKPCVRGTHIPVQDVLELIREGVPFKEIVRDYYPELTLDDIRACVQYAMEVLAAEELHVAVAA